MIRRYLLSFMLCSGLSALASAQPLNGTYTIGTGTPAANYTTIQAAVSALMGKGISGPVVFNIRPGTYSESISISPIQGTNKNTTVTFQSASGKASDVIVKAPAGTVLAQIHTFSFNASDYIILKNLTLESETGLVNQISMVEFLDGSDHITVTGCTLNMSPDAQNLLQVGFDFPDDNYIAPDNKYITISDNVLNNGGVGIYLFAGRNTTGWVISGNTFNGQDAEGLNLRDLEHSQITGNKIYADGQYGMTLDRTHHCRIEGNVIQGGLGTDASTVPTCYGLYLDGGEQDTISNNMIMAGTVSPGHSAYGARIAAENSMVVNNSIRTNYTLTTHGSCALDVSGSCRVINNILSNFSQGIAYKAYYIPGKGFSSDYNSIYTNGPELAAWNGLHYKDLNALKIGSGLEGHSIYADPLFTSPSDLHTLNPKVDGAGLPVSWIPADIDGQPRNVQVPDIGADEFTLSHPLYDIAVHAIYPMAPKGIANLSVDLVNLGVTSLKDSVIALAFSINGGSTWSAPENYKITGLDQVNFKEVFTFSTPANFAEIKKYKVCIKITSAGNIPDVNMANNLLCDSVCVTLTGAFTIGATGADFSTIGSAIAMLKSLPCGISAPVTFNIKPGTYPERVILPFIPGSSAENTITFQSENGIASSVVITGVSDAQTFHTVKLENADYIILKNITIENLAPVVARPLEIVNSSYVMVSGCIINMDAAPYMPLPLIINQMQSTHVRTGIKLYEDQLQPKGKIILTGNTINNGDYGIATWGRYDEPRDSCVCITNNTLNGQYVCGMQVTGTLHAQIIGNTIEANGLCGLYLSYAEAARVNRNIIRAGLSATNASASTFIGLNTDWECLYNVISNNMITVGTAIPVYSCYGLHLYGFNNKVYNNSIRTNYLTASNKSWALYTDSWYEDDHEVFNNILSNFSEGYAFNASPEMKLRSDYNNFYTNGAALANWNGTDMADLAALQAASGQDQHSISTDPLFLSETNLHNTNSQHDKKGMVLPDVRTDFDNELRSLGTPDIGADEFQLDPVDLSIVNISPAKAYMGSNTITVTLANEGIQSLVGSQVSLSWSADGLTWSSPQTITITKLSSSNLTEEVILTTPWIINRFENYNLQVRINSPGVAGDAVKANDVLGIPVCVVIPQGTYSVGTPSSDFADPKELADILSKLDCGIEGPVVFEIEPGTYEQSIRFGPITGASETNTITIRSKTGNASDVIIRGGKDTESEHYVICLDGTSHLKLDHLTIENNGIDVATGIHLAGVTEHVEISHCAIILDSLSMADRLNGILVSAPGSIMETGKASDLFIHHNRLVGSYAGIRILGAENNPGKGIRIEGNVFQQVYAQGITADYTNLDRVVKNTFLLRSNTESSQGIYISRCQSALEVSGNLALNGGIHLYNLTGSKQVLVANNMIGGVSQNTLANYGLCLVNTPFITVAHNSVRYSNPNGGAAFYHMGSINDSIDVLNNIFSFQGTADGYAYVVVNTKALDSSDYNDLYTDGSLFANLNTYDTDNLFDVQYYTGKEYFSRSVDPLFNSATDLHTFCTDLDGKGAYVDRVPQDFDGQQRNTTSPDIGADEFTNGTDGGVADWLNPQGGSVLKPGETQPMQIRLSNSGSTTIGNFNVMYTINGQSPILELYTGSLDPAQSADHSFATSWTPADTGTYQLCATTFVDNDGNAGNDQYCITVKVQDPTGMAVTIPVYKLYPNPASEVLYLLTGRDDIVTAELFNTAGQLVSTFENKGEDLLELDIRHLPKGMYVLKIRSDRTVHIEKVLIGY